MKRPEGIKTDIEMKQYSWFRSGGLSRYFSRPKSIAEMIDVIRWARSESHEISLLGLGANMLFPDEYFDGLVLQTTKLKSTMLKSNENFQFFNESEIDVSAGVQLERLVNSLNSQGLAGLENLAGIPGTIGGSVWGNAGAGHGSISERVVAVQCIDSNCELRWISADEFEWSYRYSGIGDHIICAVRFRVEPNSDPVRLQESSRDLKAYKESVQPYEQKSTGCIFRNPESGPGAGQLIDNAGLKGWTVGGAKISELHGNFIVNESDATTADVLELVHTIEEKIFSQTGIRLDREVILACQEKSR